MKIITEQLNGLIVMQPTVFTDERGFFMETFKASVFSSFGIPVDFVQDNHSVSRKGVIRGLHYQWDMPMGKLIRVANGRAYFAETDIRPDSPTLGKWFGIEISSANKYIMWVPPGFANGFLSLEEDTIVQYKCTAEWNPKGEGAILWNDPEIRIEWPDKTPIVSQKDRDAMTLKQWLKKPESDNFRLRVQF